MTRKTTRTSQGISALTIVIILTGLLICVSAILLINQQHKAQEQRLKQIESPLEAVKDIQTVR